MFNARKSARDADIHIHTVAAPMVNAAPYSTRTCHNLKCQRFMALAPYSCGSNVRIASMLIAARQDRLILQFAD